LHKTIKLTTNHHGKEEAIGSIPVGSLSDTSIDMTIFVCQCLFFYELTKVMNADIMPTLTWSTLSATSFTWMSSVKLPIIIKNFMQKQIENVIL